MTAPRNHHDHHHGSGPDPDRDQNQDHWKGSHRNDFPGSESARGRGTALIVADPATLQDDAVSRRLYVGSEWGGGGGVKGNLTTNKKRKLKK